MFGFRKSPLNKPSKQHPVEPIIQSGSKSNPFDSDSDSEKPQIINPSKRTSSEPTLLQYGNPFDDDDGGIVPSSSSHTSSHASRNRYKNDFRDSGGFENQTVQELENYAVHKSEETTSTVNNCLKIAEEMRDDATHTLNTLHEQGQQITRTHEMAANMDQDLSRGEKILGSLGGIFSRTWKPKKTRTITGPLITNGPSKSKANDVEQRKKLGLIPAAKARSAPQTPPSEPGNALQKIELEKEKQDDALSDLSNILGDLKHMAAEMGSELDQQNKALDHLDDDVEELNFRVKGANQRARRLLGK